MFHMGCLMTATASVRQDPTLYIRVKEDGSQERVPQIELRVGDVILKDDEPGEKKLRIAVEAVPIPNIRVVSGETARGRLNGHWYVFWCHGRDHLILIPVEPDVPFGVRADGKESVFPLPFEVAGMIVFKEVA